MHTIIGILAMLLLAVLVLVAITARFSRLGAKRPVHAPLRNGLAPLWVSPSGRAFYPIMGAREGAAAGLIEQRDKLTKEIDELLAADLPEEREAADAANATIQEKIAERGRVDARIQIVEEQEARREADAATRERLGGDQDREPTRVLSEPRTYGVEQPTRSYFLDLARDQLGRGDGDGGVDAARARLARHKAELDVELPARQEARDKIARRATDRELRAEGYSREARASVFEQRTNPNRTDGQGGNFVPPLWLVDQYIDLPRFGATAANLCRNLPLPSGTDSINLPKVATGTATGVQTADAGSVTSTDLTDTSVSAPVRTIAGQQDIAIQLLDQSPVSFDEVVMEDLLADYEMRKDIQVIAGTGSSGQVTGILNTSGVNAVTYTDATPTLPEMWVPLLQAASQVAKNRKLPATAVLQIPSLWYWALSQLDTSNRPLIVPNQAAMNSMADPNALGDFSGPAGMFTYGLPAFLDGNVPVNLGAGTNETRSITARWQDLYLWEGSMRTRVLTEILSGTLQVRLQVYNYVAFMPNRRPEAISIISGTGMIPAAGF